MVEKIRVSIGSAAVLGLENKQFPVPPRTCYVMTYIEGHCIANCGFCPQARDSTSSSNQLSRVSWPIYLFKDFLTKLKYLTQSKKFKRICIQTLNYERNFQDLREIIIDVKKVTNTPISVAIPPMSKEKLKELKIVGVERLGIALDGATEEIFDKVKGKQVNGPYKWEKHLKCLDDALDIFSRGFVSTHLIVGMGESQKEMIELIIKLNNKGILPALFAFTPIKGTKFERLNKPDLIGFRKIQLGRYLILSKQKKIKDIAFNNKGEIINLNINPTELKNIIDESNAFLTSGCPGCDRPYYTSNPSGPIYNFPRKLTEEQKEEIFNSLKRFVNF
ncbi:MAG: radical SAM protein [Promethearchaeota archaeon]|nr:MAG: radical SAM protein [Candidatus Lokiarchaeota archaeon]